MKKIYMLSGLGVKDETILEFNKFLNNQNYEIIYIDLPGQYYNIDTKIENKEDFINWIKSIVPINSIVMGYSLGADLILKFIDEINPKSTIILDGGVFGNDFMQTTLEEEKEWSRNYIKQNNLDMNPDTVCSLFDLRFDQYKDIFSINTEKDILLLLSDTPKEAYDYKLNKVKNYNKLDRKNIEIVFIENTNHDFYSEKPEEIGKEIVRYLDKF
ncbi:alpha/beta hydrolase [Helcococcus ovis]|uniref:alpha/beta hydrolase n=1 Tax=Helcococcus ovis TaxID=72026 RepID=UPI0038B955CE